jgi:hypothetical protein
MKVLNLCCANDHRFEGWFGSDDDFTSQLERSMVECPLCGDHMITRLPTAPRLNVSGATKGKEGEPSPAPADGQPQAEQLQAKWIKAVRHAIANTEDVGERFAEEARRIHYGEAEERGIRGQASADEAQSLREEGIDVVALPIPDALKDRLQ